MMTVASIIDELSHLAPLSLAADWDNVGLLLGDRATPVRRVMTCLTVTPETAAEAIEGEAQLIVTHHPVLFKAVKRLTTDTPEGAMLSALLRAGVAVYSAHTAFDDAKGGINDTIAARLGLSDVATLRLREGSRSCKVVVYVPDKDLSRVSEAMFAAGAGHIGEYSRCSFRLPGKGTFLGSEAANPTVGQKGRWEEVDEWRLEVICPDGSLDGVLRAMRQAHSYEEPAYDVYMLRPGPGSIGVGRIGTMSKAMRLEEFCKRVKALFKAGPTQIVGDPGKSVQRVAIVCGAGGELLSDAIRAKADVFLTGEMRYHDYLLAHTKNLALCLPGHHATERFAMEELAEQLQAKWPEVNVWASEKESDPVSWI